LEPTGTVRVEGAFCSLKGAIRITRREESRTKLVRLARNWKRGEDKGRDQG